MLRDTITDARKNASDIEVEGIYSNIGNDGTSDTVEEVLGDIDTQLGTTLDHLDGDTSKHDASEIDVEYVYPNIGNDGTSDTVEEVLGDIDSKCGTYDSHLDGGSSKHDASEVDVENEYTNIGSSANDDLETVLGDIDTVLGEGVPTEITASEVDVEGAYPNIGNDGTSDTVEEVLGDIDTQLGVTLDHLDGGSSKHDATEIDDENTYTHILGSPTDIDATLSAIDTAIGVAKICDSSATLPTSPVVGQWFLHTPIGRKILYCYNDSDWQTSAIISLEAITIYVDSSDGTDDMEHGIGVDSDAFATIQYAIDTIPGTFGGNVIINVNNEGYAENLVLKNKTATGDYTITFQGTMTQDDTFTGTGGTTGSGATRGTVTAAAATFVASAHKNMLIKCLTGANEGTTRLIQNNTTTTITIHQYWPSTPVNTDTYEILDWTNSIGTGSSPALIGDYIHFSVILNNLSFVSTGSWARGIQITNHSYVDLKGCKLTSGYVHNWSYMLLDYCSIDATDHAYGLWCDQASIIYLRKSRIKNADGYGIYVGGGQLVVTDGSMVNGDNNAYYGIKAEHNAAAYVEDYSYIVNNTDGIRAQTGAVVLNTSTIQYINNTTDENVIAASFGYID